VRAPRWIGARGPRVPREVVDAALVRGEKLLAATRTTDGTWLLATRERFSAVATAEGSDVVRLRWEEVQRADWDRETATLRVQPVRDYGEPVATSAYQIEEPGALFPLVRERVDASIVLQRKVPVVGKRGFTVVARRPPSGPGELTWSFEFDPGIDPDDAVVVAATDLALGEAQESLGL
jgi:hypothetical protein